MKIDLLLNLKLMIRTFVLTLSFFFLMISLVQPISLYSQVDHNEKSVKTFWQWKLPSGSQNIYYIEKGNGPRHILLLHGFAAHSFTWRFVIEDLVKAGYHVWSIDLIGFGYSDKPANYPYGLHLFTNQIEAFMQAKQINRANVIGHSMGGGLALSMAVAYPQRIQSLVLIDPLAFPLKMPFYFAMTQMLGEWAKPIMGKTIVKQILKQIMYDPRKITEEQINAYDFPLHTQGGKDAFIETLRNFNEQEIENLVSHYRDIQIPMLLIWGEKDRWMPPSYFKRLSQTFPKAKTILISNCGHAPQEECPLEVNKAILQFLLGVYGS